MTLAAPPQSAAPTVDRHPKVRGIATSKTHLQHIDCLRGYAVLMVITVHLRYAFPELPYPVARFASLGWHGVQLFFLVSALTLLSSWRAEVHRAGSASGTNFFIRRFLRIAPAYYTAALLYVFVHPNFTFDSAQLATAVTFMNSWHPATMPTLENRWMVVPGGWSIGVEFSFYALFPLIASAVTSLRRAVLAVVVSVLFGLAANMWAVTYFATTPEVALSNFLYFWLPNQLSVFMLGMVLFYLIGDSSNLSIRVLNAIRPYRYWMAGAAIVLFFAAALLPLSHYIGQPTGIPSTLFVSVPLMMFAAALASGPTIFVNRAVQELGKVSFSGYLLHFAALDLMDAYPTLFGLHATGLRAIVSFGLDWCALVPAVFLASYALYSAVELPGMNLAKSINKRRHERKERRLVIKG
jgi:peptidoglycan/LPS O-acetylase OafA/YrhL